MYVGYYSGGGRIVDVSGELCGDLYRQGQRLRGYGPATPMAFAQIFP